MYLNNHTTIEKTCINQGIAKDSTDSYDTKRNKVELTIKTSDCGNLFYNGWNKDASTSTVVDKINNSKGSKITVDYYKYQFPFKNTRITQFKLDGDEYYTTY